MKENLLCISVKDDLDKNSSWFIPASKILSIGFSAPLIDRNSEKWFVKMKVVTVNQEDFTFQIFPKFQKERQIFTEFDGKKHTSKMVIERMEEILRVKLAKLFGDDNGAIVSLQDE